MIWGVRVERGLARVRGGRMWRRIVLILLCSMLAAFEHRAAAGDREALDALVRAYPEFLAGYDATDLIWRDGTRMPLSDGLAAKSFDEMLRHGSILDQIRLPYPAGVMPAAAGPNDDPGRVRNRAFFDKMYGDCWKGEVTLRLVSVVWLPLSWGRTIRVTAVNSVDRRLAAISDELDQLPEPLKRYAYPPAGTYNCRAVADTGQPSMHSWGAAIDINTAHADYWQWHSASGYINRIPAEIVAIFERHGFIWGGKWAHYDTMHFEYRPELLANQPGQQPFRIVPAAGNAGSER
jgi:D-alanyl-D-alanine carboxypeptidase